MWHYLRECPTGVDGAPCANKALSSVIHDVGLKDLFAMCQNSDEIEVQRCAFGCVSELCRLNFPMAFHASTCELVVVLVEKSLYQVRQYKMHQEKQKQDKEKQDKEDKEKMEGQSSEHNQAGEWCHNVLMYLVLQTKTGEKDSLVVISPSFFSYHTPLQQNNPPRNPRFLCIQKRAWFNLLC